MENKTVEMVVKDLLLADNRKKKKTHVFSLKMYALAVGPVAYVSLTINDLSSVFNIPLTRYSFKHAPPQDEPW